MSEETEAGAVISNRPMSGMDLATSFCFEDFLDFFGSGLDGVAGVAASLRFLDRSLDGFTSQVLGSATSVGIFGFNPLLSTRFWAGFPGCWFIK